MNYKIEIATIEDLKILKENEHIECKSGSGKDGQGQLPKAFWPTYSAFANTKGGLIILGVGETKDGFIVQGIKQEKKIIDDLFNQLNDPAKVSCNLVTEKQVQIHNIENKKIITVQVLPALRKKRPVYLNGNPRNTYRRLGEGDRLCDLETVKRMLAEQEDRRDNRIFVGFNLNDINLESLRAYRNRLYTTKPSHPFLANDDFGFLKIINGWRVDRETGEEGLTLAGLLLLGKWEAIQEGVPHYFLDYQEQEDSDTEERWIYRLFTDGTWSGNLFDFFHKIYPRLITDLDIPFIIRDGQRKDEDTPAHIALREALVNTIVHADYSGVRTPLRVIKKPKKFEFRNPGLMRIPSEIAKIGGESDCRNPYLHQMFLNIGLGERAGSGVPKIYSGWQNCNWKPPILRELDHNESTLLELQKSDLIPKEKLLELKSLYGNKFDTFDEADRIILTAILSEKQVSHARISELIDSHPRDISSKLRTLLNQGMIESQGKTRGVTYKIPEKYFSHLNTPYVLGDSYPSQPLTIIYKAGNEAFSTSDRSIPLPLSSIPLRASSVPFTSNSELLLDDEKFKDMAGKAVITELDAPIIDNLENLNSKFHDDLLKVSNVARVKRRLKKDQMILIILTICKDNYITLPVLSKLLNRNAHKIRMQYIRPLIKEKKLRFAFPDNITHPKQAYKVTENHE